MLRFEIEILNSGCNKILHYLQRYSDHGMQNGDSINGGIRFNEII